MRTVFDTNCLIVCLSASSPYYCIWQAFRQKRIILCFTTEILNEYCEILEHFYPLQYINDIMNELLLSKNVVKTVSHFRWDLITADPDDNKFVDCALMAGADAIVTNDHHFNILKTIPFPPLNVISIESFRKMLSSFI